MTINKLLAGAAAASALLASPALAVDSSSVTFAQFTQQSADKVAQYGNTGSGNTLDITLAPANFVVFAYGAPGVYSTVMSMTAASSAMVTTVGQQFEQRGWTGSIQFGNATNFLTTNFVDATFSFDSTGGSASLISTDPSSTINYSSTFLNVPNFEFKNFSLAFTGLSPAFSVAANGYGNDFNANIAGSFAGSEADGTIGAAIPEPASWAMMIIGFGLTGFTLRRRKATRVVAC